MQIRIEVPEAVVQARTIPASTRTGFKGGTFYSQDAYAVMVDRNTGKPNRYPSKIVLPKDEGEAPYAVGFYEVDVASFVVGDFEKLSLGRLKLSPVPNTASSAKGA